MPAVKDCRADSHTRHTLPGPAEAFASKGAWTGQRAPADGCGLPRPECLSAGARGAQEVACVAFSPDGRLIAAQGGAPEWNLVIWNWEKSKVAGMFRTCNASGAPVHQARPAK